MRTLRRDGFASIEIAAALVVASLAVAALDAVAPIAGLGVIYLLAVLLVAIRHGELAALATAVLAGVAGHLFFLDPRPPLAIAGLGEGGPPLLFLVHPAGGRGAGGGGPPRPPRGGGPP